MKQWLRKSVIVVGLPLLGLGLLIGLVVGMFYGMVFLMNRSTSVHVESNFAMVRFPLSPLQQVVLSRGLLGPDTIRVIKLPFWYDRFTVLVSVRDKELFGIAEYSECMWRWDFGRFQSITTCTMKSGPLPSELREAIQKGRELLATAYP